MPSFPEVNVKENTLSVPPFPDVPGPAAVVKRRGLSAVQGNVLRLRASFVEVMDLLKGTLSAFVSGLSFPKMWVVLSVGTGLEDAC